VKGKNAASHSLITVLIISSVRKVRLGSNALISADKLSRAEIDYVKNAIVDLTVLTYQYCLQFGACRDQPSKWHHLTYIIRPSSFDRSLV
jgi:hypothetical protein